MHISYDFLELSGLKKICKSSQFYTLCSYLTCEPGIYLRNSLNLMQILPVCIKICIRESLSLILGIFLDFPGLKITLFFVVRMVPFLRIKLDAQRLVLY